MQCPIVTIAILSVLTCATHALAQQPVAALSFRGDGFVNGSGVSVAALGDLDGDGFVELAIGLPLVASGDGEVRVHSGRNATLLTRLVGPFGAGERFGWNVASVGDLDGDGVAEFAVAAPLHRYRGETRGSVQVFSGATLGPIRFLRGDGDGDLFGSAIAGAGDIDGDGTLDLIIGAPENGNAAASYGPGYAEVFSGRDYRVLQHFDGVAVGDEFGSSVAGVGDLDGDGRDDVIVGALLETGLGAGQGSARVFSGRTGAPVLAMFAERFTDHFGIAVGALGDVDRDGVIDLFVAAIGMTNPDNGSVTIHSGRDATVIARIRGDANAGVFGRCAFVAGDVDQDGYVDLGVSDPMAMLGGQRLGAVHLISGRDWSVITTMHGPRPGMSGFGGAVVAIPDLDRDGRPELGIAVPAWPQSNGGRDWRVEIMTHARDVSIAGAGCGGAVEPRLDTSGARLGGVMPLFVSGRPVIAPGVLLASPVPALPLAVDGRCTLYIDVAAAALLAPVLTDPSGRWLGWANVPGSPALLGARFAMQAALLTPTGVELTHGAQVTIRP